MLFPSYRERSNGVLASKPCRDSVSGLDAQPAIHAGAMAPQPQFAPPQACEPDGTIAKQPAAGPTSRLLRVFLHERLDGWRRRMSGHEASLHAAANASEGATQIVPGPMLDKDRLAELCANFSAAEAREFIWLCIVDTELRLADIASHRAAGDMKRVAQVAHQIAREAANLGALHVHVLALRLETACHSGRSVRTCGLIGELSEAWAQAGDTMCAWLSEQASSSAKTMPARNAA